jgi:uncharacterized NAD(P)/FAD-binding protein YdhS
MDFYGLIRSGLGMEVDGDGRVLSGNAKGRLFALGVWTRGSLWEVVAVPHIRDAARRVVAALMYFDRQFDATRRKG